MASLVSVPVSAFLLLFGLYLPLPPELSEDEEMDEQARAKALRRRAMFAIARLASQGFGIFLLLLHLILGPGSIQDSGAFVLLVGLYGGLMLIVQRSEVNRRLATLFFMGFCGLIVWRYAKFRDYEGESSWAIYISLTLNYIFAITIGKRFPVGSSQDIHVWGMDE